MPRSRRNRQEEQFEFYIDEDEINPMCSDHLNKRFYELIEKTNESVECSICLERICCKNCFTLKSCGHHFHLSCLIRVKDSRCPVCRK